MTGRNVAVTLASLASDQSGLVTAAQARQLGVSNVQLSRLANSGVWQRIRHGVYASAAAGEDDLRELRAAWLSLDPSHTATERLNCGANSGVVSHRAAAHVHSLGVLQGTLEFTLPRRKQSRDRSVRLHCASLASDDWSVVRGLPVTTMRRTICDLAAVNTDGGHLAEIVRDAVVSGKVQLGELADALSPYAHAYGAPEEDGRALLQQFLENAGVPVHIGEVAALTLDLTASAQTDKAQGEKVHDV